MGRMLLVSLMMGMLYWAASANSQETPSRAEKRRPHTVSLIRLIANPGEYDGQHIRVIGYLAGAGVDDAPGVFLSESDGRNGILSNALNLSVSDRTIRGMFGKYVIVSGLYHAPAPQGDFNGYIDHIVEVKPLNVRNSAK